MMFSKAMIAVMVLVSAAVGSVITVAATSVTSTSASISTSATACEESAEDLDFYSGEVTRRGSEGF